MTKFKYPKIYSNGFTLVELLLVIAIVGIILLLIVAVSIVIGFIRSQM